MTTAYYSFQQHFEHDTGLEHPEHALRILAIEQELKNRQIWDEMTHIEGQKAELADVLRAHSPGYVEQLGLIQPKQGHILVDEDTPMSAGSLEAAYYSAGSCLMALDAVLNNQFHNAFVAVRPPGHHAEARLSKGFCFFNNAAITALRATDKHFLQRVAVLDFDAHQCNGTIDILKDDPRFLICTSFQHPFYPYSHYQQYKFSNVVNSYLAENEGSKEFRQAVLEQWLPALEGFAPEAIIVSAGFDAHKEDPQANLCFEDDDYRWIGEQIQHFCQVRNLPWVALLEGGYELNALGRSVSEFVEQMLIK